VGSGRVGLGEDHGQSLASNGARPMRPCHFDQRDRVLDALGLGDRPEKRHARRSSDQHA
jgi:hypothetical protein